MLPDASDFLPTSNSSRVRVRVRIRVRIRVRLRVRIRIRVRVRLRVRVRVRVRIRVRVRVIRFACGLCLGFSSEEISASASLVANSCMGYVCTERRLSVLK